MHYLYITYVRATGIEISMIFLPQERFKVQLILSSISHALQQNNFKTQFPGNIGYTL